MDILDHPLIAARYFFPRPDPVPDPFFVHVEGATLACWRRSPYPDAPTLLHFHGNGEVVSDYVPWMADQLLALGVNVFFAEYRGYGESTGEPLLGKMLGDVEPLLQATGMPDGRVIVFGRSVGSLFAVELVHRHRGIGGLVLESGIADPRERLLLRVSGDELGVSDEAFEAACKARLDHEQKLADYAGPTLIMHTGHDGLVDVDHAERNHAWARRAEDKKLVVFEGGNHNTIFFVNHLEYLREVAALVARVLARTTSSGPPKRR